MRWLNPLAVLLLLIVVVFAMAKDCPVARRRDRL
jgi:hypothetical protein